MINPKESMPPLERRTGRTDFKSFLRRWGRDADGEGTQGGTACRGSRVRSQKSEVRSQKPEVRNQKSTEEVARTADLDLRPLTSDLRPLIFDLGGHGGDELM